MVRDGWRINFLSFALIRRSGCVGRNQNYSRRIYSNVGRESVYERLWHMAQILVNAINKKTGLWQREKWIRAAGCAMMCEYAYTYLSVNVFKRGGRKRKNNNEKSMGRQSGWLRNHCIVRLTNQNWFIQPSISLHSIFSHHCVQKVLQKQEIGC